MNVKFMWNGIKVDGELYSAHYSIGNYTERSGIPKEAITIYAKDYRSFPAIEGLTIQNESDIMTDYFEKDRILVYPNNRWYNEVKSACEKMNEHIEKRLAKRYAR